MRTPLSRDHSLRFFNDLQSFYINSDSTSLTYQSSRKDSGTKDLDLKGSTNVLAGLGITGWECWVQLTLFFITEVGKRVQNKGEI